MSYDFGSQTLGINNPFKTEGKFRAASGALLFLAGLIPLFNVSSSLKTEPVLGYTYAILGFILLAAGSRHLGVGLFQLFRYFVGRSVPTSLAFNRSRSESDTANAEKKALLYDDDQLHSMLMGRKNTTFAEPVGWVARLIHSVFPNLTFLPYPIRHIGQEVGAMAINFATAFISYLIVFFVVSTGLAGIVVQEIATPALSLLLLIYLVISWRRSAAALSTVTETHMHSSAGASFGTLIAMSILIPVIIGFGLDEFTGWTAQEVSEFTDGLSLFSAWPNLGLLLVATLIVIGTIIPPLKKRAKGVTPSTDVSEYRDNMQENVHPNEIFINIENIVLANRRYKEIPNRIYREFDPKLIEQAEGKGAFKGELLVETQPQLALDDEKLPSRGQKILLTGAAQIALLLGYVFFVLLALNIADIISYFLALPGPLLSKQTLLTMLPLLNDVLVSLFAWLTFQAAAKMLNNASHIFWGELQFSSLLMYMKTEGTYTESRISTGMAIHDSTRSENVVVRSSITPWIITTRLLTSIFATSGSGNLESPRFIMGMMKNDDEMEKIKTELKSFLRGRESIASITNEGDLQNASTIHQVNQQTRAIPIQEAEVEKLNVRDNDAAGFLRNNDADGKK
ncbi:hypothetical protein CA267_008185 [Alteromonas pelagimontana]|uniref:Uncharacterized protein n=1 Tax=Alteromonas pelagimontana TaxID=1858656 RepID=A0A6M4MF12_9ALTE|nr:hypothetical protein [Alteromonas pelagimontana]QJR80756.1 hypothetical protein CA267_008185 [Alteromonas pelagimontana]